MAHTINYEDAYYKIAAAMSADDIKDALRMQDMGSGVYHSIIVYPETTASLLYRLYDPKDPDRPPFEILVKEKRSGDCLAAHTTPNAQPVPFEHACQYLDTTEVASTLRGIADLQINNALVLPTSIQAYGAKLTP